MGRGGGEGRRESLEAALERAARACERHKRSKPAAIAFRARQTQELAGLAARLREGRYVPQPGTVLVSRHPKHREIHAAAYRDRVVHHLLHGILEPLFEPAFIADSYACRKGKGTLAASDRLTRALREATRQGGRRAWYLQLDVRNFFVSIHRPTLLALLRRGIERARARGSVPQVPEGLDLDRLLETVVLHDASAHARRYGDPAEFARVPRHKRLGASGPRHGLPIGNLTSQFFANVYLDPLDQFVKRTLGARHYVRYVDDFVLVHDRPEVLIGWRDRIVQFLHDRFGLELHQRPLRPVSAGVDFVGYVTRPGYRLVRRRVLRGFEAKLRAFEAELRPQVVLEGQVAHVPGVGTLRGPLRWTAIDLSRLELLRASWASFVGQLSHSRSRTLQERAWAWSAVSRKWLRRRRFDAPPGRRLVLPRASLTLRAQLWRLRRPLGRTAMVAQVGPRAVLPFDRPSPRWVRRGELWRSAGRIAGWFARRARSVMVVVEDAAPSGLVQARRCACLVEPVSMGG